MMTTALAVALIGGPVLSTVVSFILGRGFSKEVGVALTIFACILVAAATTFLSDGFVVDNVRTVADGIRFMLLNFAVLYVSTTTFYSRVSHPTGLAEKLNDTGPQIGTKSKRKVVS